MRSRQGLLVFSAALLTPGFACAFNVFKVDPNCVAYGAFDKIQEAVNEAAATAGTDYVWISNGHHTTTYAGEHVTINDADGVIIEGGFADCFDSNPGTDTTTIGGDGATAVFEITGNSWVTFGNLVVTGAGNSGIRFNGQGSVTLGAYTQLAYNISSYGGGIYFEALNGDATLNLDGADVHDNQSGTYGGGVHVVGNNGKATLNVLNGARIQDNSAGYSGGGISLGGAFLGQARLLAQSPTALVTGNTVARIDGYGGGIYIGPNARADLSNVVHDNRAANGGGVAVMSTGVLRMFPHDLPGAVLPPSILDNTATASGGGIYAEGDVCLFDTGVVGNSAPAGAAIYQYTGGTYINDGFPARLGTECGPETVAALGGNPAACQGNCSQISYNTATYPTGPVWHERGELIASNLRIQANTGSYVLDMHDASANLHTCLMTGNQADSLISADGGTGTVLSACTFADTTLPADAAVFKFFNGAAATFNDDIIAEPGHVSVQTTGPLSAAYVLANDISTLPTSPTVAAGNPLFVAAGDYHLTGQSPAVDFAPAIGGSDLDGSPRDVDLARASNRFGPADLGAYERQFAFACDHSDDAVFCDDFEAPQP